MDERLRSLERDGIDDLRFVTEALRTGRLTRERVRTAAYLGHAGARAWLEDGARRRPRWRLGPLRPWSDATGGTLTERVERAGVGERDDLLRAAAAQVALGRRTLPAVDRGLSLDAEYAHDDCRCHVRLRAAAEPMCLATGWLAGLALDAGACWPEDLSVVGEVLRHARIQPLGPAEVAPRLAHVRRDRAWLFEVGGRHPWLVALEAQGEVLLPFLACAGRLHPELDLRDGDELPLGPVPPARALRRLAATGELAAGAWSSRAAALEALGDVDGVDRALAEGVARHPRDHGLASERAAFHERLAEHELAAAEHGRAADVAPGPAWRADALCARARALLQAGAPGRAVPALEAAAALRPDSRTRTLLARARRESGDPAGALREARLALERAPDDAEALREWNAALLASR